MTKWPVRARGKEIGRVTSAIHSPRLKKNIGYAMVPIAFSDLGTEVEVIHPSGTRKARVVKKPFIDPGRRSRRPRQCFPGPQELRDLLPARRLARAAHAREVDRLDGNPGQTVLVARNGLAVLEGEEVDDRSRSHRRKIGGEYVGKARGLPPT